jgi:hypothetical protein
MDQKTAFLELSALLTGIPRIATDPQEKILSRSTVDEYFRRLSAEFPDGLAELVSAYQRLAEVSPRPAIDDALLAKLRAELAFKSNEFVARQIVNIWYFSQFRATDDENAPFIDGGFYERGLVWPVIKAHPIGFSDQPHGYWTSQP